MKIIGDFDIDYGVFPESDAKLLKFLSNIPFFIRRLFVVVLETPEEEAFLEFYTSAGFGEYCDGSLIRLKLSEWGDGITRVVLCNYIGDGTAIADQVFDHLDQFIWDRKETNNPLCEIDLYEALPSNTVGDKTLYEKTIEYLDTCELDFDIEAIKATRTEEIRREEEYKKEYIRGIHQNYDSIEVDFLAE